VGRRLAEVLNRTFADADDFHSPESVQKMSASIPLTDSDRVPWLKSVRDWMNRQNDEGNGTVVACSALKRAYRDALRAASGEVLFVHLSGTSEVIRGRLDGRSGHFMPSTLLASQFEALEPLTPEENGLKVDVESSVDSIVAAVCDRIQVAG
jgi:gluconokinase